MKSLFISSLSSRPANDDINRYSGQQVELKRPATAQESDVPLLLVRTECNNEIWVFPDELNPQPNFDYAAVGYTDYQCD